MGSGRAFGNGRSSFSPARRPKRTSLARRILGLVLLLVLASSTAYASETTSYTYDARGRLVKVEHSGTVNNGVTANYTYDKADNRQNVTVTGTAVILRESFEGGAPAVLHKSDGGTTYFSQPTNFPPHGGKAVRLGMVGSHTWSFTGTSFVATQSVVTLSIYVRDANVLNNTINGGWSGSSVPDGQPVALGLYNATTGSWALDASTDPTGGKMPPSSGGWVRHTRTIGGLTLGNTYSVSVMGQPYVGVRASDIDALQVEYGGAATPYDGLVLTPPFILRESFEGSLPAVTYKSDGGYVYLSQATNAPVYGSKAVHFGMVGSHTFALGSDTFVAAQTTVTLSIYVRDSGINNSTLAGWSGSSANAAHPILLGLYNVTTGSWTLDATTDPSGGMMPPGGGGWVRHTRTISGLTVGQTYAPAIMMQAYSGVRASDGDALQIEYGTSATPFAP